MKRFIPIAVTALVCLAYVGCDAQQTNDPIREVALADLPPGALALPTGSEVWTETVDGTAAVRFQLPEPYALMGQVETAGGVTVQLAPGGGITCTCTEGDGGCSPFKAAAGGKVWVGCSIDTARCTECQMTSTSFTSPDGEPGAQMENAIIVDRARPIRVVETYEQADALGCGAATLIKDPATVQAIADFIRPYLGPDPAYVLNADPDNLEDDVVTAPLDVYGHLLWVPVRLMWVDMTDSDIKGPTSELMWDRYVTSVDASGADMSRNVPGDGPCTCETGGGGCIYGRERAPLIGYIEFCDAQGCNSCSLAT